MKARLILVAGKANKAEVRLKLPMIVGRTDEAGLMIAHKSVSRRHCELFERHGMIFVRDTGSLNGTLVDNAPIKEAMLKPGHTVTVGPLTFRAEYEPADAFIQDDDALGDLAAGTIDVASASGVSAAPPGQNGNYDELDKQPDSGNEGDEVDFTSTLTQTMSVNAMNRAAEADSEEAQIEFAAEDSPDELSLEFSSDESSELSFTEVEDAVPAAAAATESPAADSAEAPAEDALSFASDDDLELSFDAEVADDGLGSAGIDDLLPPAGEGEISFDLIDEPAPASDAAADSPLAATSAGDDDLGLSFDLEDAELSPPSAQGGDEMDFELEDLGTADLDLPEAAAPAAGADADEAVDFGLAEPEETPPASSAKPGAGNKSANGGQSGSPAGSPAGTPAKQPSAAKPDGDDDDVDDFLKELGM